MSLAGIPMFAAFQLAAASILLNTPRPAPAYIVLGFVESITRALTLTKGSPDIALVQLPPPSVLLKME